MRFQRMTEHQIQKARAEGQLDGLEGEGKPLPPRLPGDAAEQAGFRIMAEAGALPAEIRLARDINALLGELKSITDPEARKNLQAKISDLQMRQEMEREARKAFLR